MAEYLGVSLDYLAHGGEIEPIEQERAIPARIRNIVADRRIWPYLASLHRVVASKQGLGDVYRYLQAFFYRIQKKAENP